MILGSKEVEAILESSLVLDFIKITLTQQRDTDPIIYCGPGSIFQDMDGTLQLKMYPPLELGEDVAREINDSFSAHQLTAGKIIGKQYYYSLEAMDMQGRHWKEEYVWLDIHTSFHAAGAGKVIKASLRSITNTSERHEKEDKSKTDIFFIVSGKHKIPCNKYEEIPNGSSLNICKLNVYGAECEIKKRENHLELYSRIPQGTEASIFPDLLLEAISVGVGSFLRPLVMAITTESTRTTSLFSKTTPISKPKLQAPIPISRPDEAKYLNEFVNKYIASFNVQISPFFGYWYRILSASSGELENQALVLTTSIEGVLKVYYSEYGLPDPEFSAQVSSAAEKIKSLKIEKRAKDRILSNLENAKSASPKAALYELAKEKRIQDDLVKIWVKLRNKSAHADELKKNDLELQEFLDETNGCLELFYYLLLYHIKYTGNYYQYSKSDWPVISMAEDA